MDRNDGAQDAHDPIWNKGVEFTSCSGRSRPPGILFASNFAAWFDATAAELRENSGMNRHCLSFDGLWLTDANPILREVGYELSMIAEEAKVRAINRLHELLGELVEDKRILANTATILLATGDETLRTVATVNLRRDGLEISTSDRGIVPWVARKREPRFVANVETEPDYFEDVETTRSELAVPLLLPNRALIGVVNLESEKLKHFSLKSLKAVLRRAGEIITQLLVLWELATGRENRLPWHPEIHGWDLECVTSRVCHAIARSLDRDTTQAALIYVDTRKDEFNIYATSGAGAAFRSHRRLRLSKTEFGGAFRRSGRGAVPYNPERDFVLRGRKLLTVDGGWLIRIGPVKNESDQNQGSAAMIVFFTAGADRDELTVTSRNTNVREALAKFGRVLEKWRQTFSAIRPLMALSRLNSRIEPMARRRHKFEALLETALSLLPAAAGSIFAVPANTTKLMCVATTGVATTESTWPEADKTPLRECTYDLIEDAHDKTVIAAHSGGMPMRFNRVRGYPSPKLKNAGAALRSKFLEVFPAEYKVHRRLLMASIIDAGEILGVIRMARTLDQKPFTLCDAEMLRCLAQSASRIVHIWRDDEADPDRQREERHDLDKTNVADYRVRT